MKEPLDECDGCGADLFDGVVHDCPVTGSQVVVQRVVEVDESQKKVAG